MAVCLAILAPLRENWAAEPRDDFPFSYYPMFSARRGATTTVHHAVAVSASGEELPLRYRYLGAGGFNQVRRQTRRLVKEGRSAELVQRVAERVAGARKGELRDAVSVRIVTSKYDLNEFFHGEHRPVSRRVRAEQRIQEQRQ